MSIRRCVRSHSRCPRPGWWLHRVEIGQAQLLEPSELSREALLSVGEAVREARFHEAAVAAGTAPTDGVALQQHDIDRRIAALGADRGPQPGVTAPHHAEVGRYRADQRGAGDRLIEVVEPVGIRLGLGERLQVDGGVVGHESGSVTASRSARTPCASDPERSPVRDTTANRTPSASSRAAQEFPTAVGTHHHRRRQPHATFHQRRAHVVAVEYLDAHVVDARVVGPLHQYKLDPTASRTAISPAPAGALGDGSRAGSRDDRERVAGPRPRARRGRCELR